MSVLGVIFGMFSPGLLNVLSVGAFVATTLMIFVQAAYQDSDDYVRSRVLVSDDGLRPFEGYENRRLTETRAMYFHVLQHWKDDARKQVILLTGRLLRKQELVRNHCKSMIDILKEELAATETQAKLIPAEDTVDNAKDMLYLENQLSMVRKMVEDLEDTLQRYPVIRSEDFGRVSPETFWKNRRGDDSCMKETTPPA